MDLVATKAINEYKRRIEALGEGYNHRSFLRTILGFVDDSRVFNLNDVSPAFQLEIAKMVETQRPLTVHFTVNDKKTISMESEPIVPGEPIQVVFKKEKFSESMTFPTQFAFKLEIPDLHHSESGMLFLQQILDTSILKGGVREKGSSSSSSSTFSGRRTHFFSYDFYSDETYALFASNHLPDMSVVFEVTHEDGSNVVSLESMRLVVRYDPQPVRHILPPGMPNVFNVSRSPYKTVSSMPRSSQEFLPIQAVHDVEEGILKTLQGMSFKTTLGYQGTTIQAGDENLTVPWGEISDLAIATALQKLTADVSNALDSPAYLVDVLERSDRRGRDLLAALERLYGSREKISTLRQFMMHTSGLVESMPESFFRNFIDTMEAATETMTRAGLFSFLPKFTPDDNTLEAELVIMLNTLEMIEREVPLMPFRLNTLGNTRYDYAILGMVIRRIDNPNPTLSAQEIITKTLRLKSSVFWNPQIGRDGKSMVEGPQTIHTLRNGVFSTLKTLGIFVKALASEASVIEAQTIDRVRDISVDPTENLMFRTMVWQGMYAEENPVPIFFRTSNLVPTQKTMVYIAPHLGLYGSMSMGIDAVAHRGVYVAGMLADAIYAQLSSAAKFVEHVAAETVMEIVETGSEAVMTTRDILETSTGPVSIQYILPVHGKTTLTSPFASVVLNAPESVTFVPNPENVNSRVNVVRSDGSIESKLVIDYGTGHIYRMGEKVDGVSNHRVIVPEPVSVDHTMYKGVDGSFYLKPQDALPSLKRIENNIQQFHNRLHDTPVHNMVQPNTMDPRSLGPLAQDVVTVPIHQLTIQHCHGKKHHHDHYHTSYYHRGSESLYSQF